MTGWSSGWREMTLRKASVPITEFALNVLHLWEQSTPTQRWTNNPLGMPSHGYSAPRALNSPYAAFPTMQAFYKAFNTAAHAGNGEPLFTMLGTSENYAEAWRVIHALGWPANGTETDHPVKVLDKLTDDPSRYLPVSQPDQRKTVGVEPVQSNHGAIVRAQADALHKAASQFNSAPLAIKFIADRMRNYG